MEFDLIYIALGLAVGILVGVTGVGGGSLVTPVLTMIGITPAVAVGTDLVFAARLEERFIDTVRRLGVEPFKERNVWHI